MEHRQIWLYLVLAVSGGCASHGAVHVAPDESRPHITWEIRAGAEEGDERFVCGSTKPAAPCVLSASSPDRRSLTTVHIYLHPALRPTTYKGLLGLPFLGSSTMTERKVDETVSPNTPPAGITVTGLVTSKRGSYALRVQLDATQTDTTAGPTPIVEQVTVTVK